MLTKYDSNSSLMILMLPFLFGCALMKSSTSSTSQAQNAPCATPSGVTGSPVSINEVVALANALPQSSVGCFLESLTPPLKVFASNSTISLQPAEGNANPRIFIFGGTNLLMTVVPVGPTSTAVELGEGFSNGTSSVKGSLQFPLPPSISNGYPYSSILALPGTGTKCQGCHLGETPLAVVDSAQTFYSFAIKPDATTEVDQGFLRSEALNCDYGADPNRCRILNAIFVSGAAVRQGFPSSPGVVY